MANRFRSFSTFIRRWSFGRSDARKPSLHRCRGITWPLAAAVILGHTTAIIVCEQRVPIPPSHSTIPFSHDLHSDDRILHMLTIEHLNTLLEQYNSPELTAYANAALASDRRIVTRYLLGHSQSPSAAARGLFDTMLWRCTNGIDNITVETVESKLREDCGAMFVSEGRALDGSAVIYNRKSPNSETDHAAQMNAMIYTLERAIESMSDRENDQWIWVIDLANWSRSSGTSFRETERIVNMLRHHYVERLNHAIIINAPQSFEWLFSLVKRLLPERTRRKATFVRGRDSDIVSALTRFIDINQIETTFGGSNAIIQFDLERYIQSDPLLRKQRKSQ